MKGSKIILYVKYALFIPGRGSSKSELFRGSPKGLVDPWKQFQLYTFSLEGPVSICGERDVFQFLMSAFNQYEFEVGYCKYTSTALFFVSFHLLMSSYLIKAKSQYEGLGKQSENLLKKLLKHLDEHKINPAVFDENFPFYVLLAIRMYR